MRDVTKALTSYTWAMSVFWTQQMSNLMGLGGSGAWNRSTRSLHNVTDATAEEMGETMRAVFRGGDTLQRGLVDVLLAPFSFGNWCGGSDNGRGGQRREREQGQGAREWGGDRDVGWGPAGRAAASDPHYQDDGAQRRWRDGARQRDGGSRGDWDDGSGDPWSGRGGSGATGGWVDTAVRAASAGVGAMQAAVDTTDRVMRRPADDGPMSSPPPMATAPAANDPSLGWGPMPR